MCIYTHHVSLSDTHLLHLPSPHNSANEHRRLRLSPVSSIEHSLFTAPLSLQHIRYTFHLPITAQTSTAVSASRTSPP